MVTLWVLLYPASLDGLEWVRGKWDMDNWSDWGQGGRFEDQGETGKGRELSRNANGDRTSSRA